MNQSVRVAVALLLDHEGKMLLGQRPPDGRLPGFWEFPGGKPKAAESDEVGLARELREELGITINDAEFLHRSINSYETGGSFSVAYYIVRTWTGEIDARHYQESAWFAPAELMEVRHLEGNVPFCRELAQGKFREHLAE